MYSYIFSSITFYFLHRLSLIELYQEGMEQIKVTTGVGKGLTHLGEVFSRLKQR
jgi:hypothetical protein